jgi:uncharacterized protein (TIGR03437 family)
MKLLLVTLLSMLALLMAVPITQGRVQDQAVQTKFRRHSNRLPGRYIVVLKDEAAGTRGESSLAGEVGAALTQAHGGSIERVYKHALNGFSARMSEAEAMALSQDPKVAYVEEDAEVSVHPIKPDGLKNGENGDHPDSNSSQDNATWGIDRVDQRQLPLNKSYVYDATGRGVHVYIIDTGIRRTHQEFGGRVVAAFDALDDGQNSNDCNGHGTHVAGTVGGATYGVAKEVTLYSVRVLPCNNKGDWAAVIAGVDWVTAHHIKPAVANMSIGGSAHQATDDAVKNSIAAGVTYCISAGNDNVDACEASPARAPNTITVGSTTRDDERSSFSNHGTCVNIFAPGSGITSAWFTGDSAINTISGTSMASPHVAGVAALFLEANPRATPAAVTAALINSATRDLVTDPRPGSPNLLLFSKISGTGGDPCTNCTRYSGSLLFTSDEDFQPDGTFYHSNASGHHKGWLRGPAATDFDLYLWKKDGTQWVVVAKSEGESSSEEVSYEGSPGDYSWRIFAYAGSGSYDFWLQKPSNGSSEQRVVSVSAATYNAELASEAIATAFGTRLATAVQSAPGTSADLPTELAGTRVLVTDSAGGRRLAPLFFVSPTQVNYLMPRNTSVGTATVTITSGDGTVSTGTAEIGTVAPGMFTANADGKGVPAAYVHRVRGDLSSSSESLSRLDFVDGRFRFVPRPIDLGPDSDRVYLIMFGTGVRYRQALTTVSVRIGGVQAEVIYAGPQGQYFGQDQINVRVPRTLRARGEVDVEMTVDGKIANTVKLNIR